MAAYFKLLISFFLYFSRLFPPIQANSLHSPCASGEVCVKAESRSHVCRLLDFVSLSLNPQWNLECLLRWCKGQGDLLRRKQKVPLRVGFPKTKKEVRD